MNTAQGHNDPRKPDPDRRPAFERDTSRGDGLGAIIAVAAVAGIIIVGLLYIMQPPAPGPTSVTTEAPPVTTPAPARPAEPSK
jgi:hypothetical protein